MGDVRQEIALYNKSTIEILYRIILGGGDVYKRQIEVLRHLFFIILSLNEKLKLD